MIPLESWKLLPSLCWVQAGVEKENAGLNFSLVVAESAETVWPCVCKHRWLLECDIWLFRSSPAASVPSDKSTIGHWFAVYSTLNKPKKATNAAEAP